jgi:hypothetical protein
MSLHDGNDRVDLVEPRDLGRMIFVSCFGVAFRLGVVGNCRLRRCRYRGGHAPVLPVVQALAAASSRPGVAGGLGRILPVMDDPNTRRQRLTSEP